MGEMVARFAILRLRLGVFWWPFALAPSDRGLHSQAESVRLGGRLN
jgi:hypothetical protein